MKCTIIIAALLLCAASFGQQRISVSAVGSTVPRERFATVWAEFLKQHELKDGAFTRSESATTAQASRLYGRVVQVIDADSVLVLGHFGTPTDGQWNGSAVLVRKAHGLAVDERVRSTAAYRAGTRAIGGDVFRVFVEQPAQQRPAPIPDTPETQAAFLAALKDGQTFTVTLSENVPCKPCSGTGMVEIPERGKINGTKQQCKACKGRRGATVDTAVTLAR